MQEVIEFHLRPVGALAELALEQAEPHVSDGAETCSSQRVHGICVSEQNPWKPAQCGLLAHSQPVVVVFCQKEVRVVLADLSRNGRAVHEAESQR